MSYLFGSEDEAVLVDPDPTFPERYLRSADRQGASVVAILLTRLRVEDLAVHELLLDRTGASIYVSSQADCRLPHQDVEDEEMILVGSSLVVAMETPPILPDSMAWYVDGDDRRVVFTGEASVEALALVLPDLPGDTVILTAFGPAARPGPNRQPLGDVPG